MDLSTDNPIVSLVIVVLLLIIMASLASVLFLDIGNEALIDLDPQDNEGRNNEEYTRFDAYKDVNICFTNETHKISFNENSNVSTVDILEVSNNTTLNNATVYKTIESPNEVVKINESGSYIVKSVTESGKTAYLIELVI